MVVPFVQWLPVYACLDSLSIIRGHQLGVSRVDQLGIHSHFFRIRSLHDASRLSKPASPTVRDCDPGRIASKLRPLRSCSFWSFATDPIIPFIDYKTDD
jgi:hypothetical protein